MHDKVYWSAMGSGSVSGWQLFSLIYFSVLLAALVGAVTYRQWVARTARERFAELMARRRALYEILPIVERESRGLSTRTDEELQGWLAAGPSSWPEGQALRDVDRELEILQGDMEVFRPPDGLEAVAIELSDGLSRTRRWIGAALGARSVAQVRMALSVTSDKEAQSRLAAANATILQFARRHGIKEPESFYDGSHFYL